MQNNKTFITNSLLARRRKAMLFGLVSFLFVMLWNPFLWAAPEKQKQTKRPPAAAATAPVKTSTINDANIQEALKRADEMVKKGEIDNPLRILLSVYEYSKEVLHTVKFFQGHYDKAVNDPATSQAEKEDIYLKLKRMGQLAPKYNNIREATTYNIGYLYAKKGEKEKARKYLTEVLELTPFSTKKDSICVKAKTLLLGLYGLEGEF